MMIGPLDEDYVGDLAGDEQLFKAETEIVGRN
jgi:hypothetical protein